MELELFSRYGPALLSGFGVTVVCWLSGTAGGMILGFFIALAARYCGKFVRAVLRAYIETIRGTPFLIQLFILYYGGPMIGIRLGSLSAGILGLVIYGSPYFAEIFRAGFNAVPRGQIEAGAAIGMAEPTIVWRIMLPILLVSSVPALTNFSIILTKETAILSIVTVPELLYEVQTMSAETFAFAEATFALAMFYWLLVEVVSRIGKRVEVAVTGYLQQERATL